MKWTSAGLALFGVAGSLLCLSSSAQAQGPLGTASDFAVLAGQSVTNTGPTVVADGSLGVSPGSAITGFPPGVVVGTIHSADATSAEAQSDLTTAYNDLAALPCEPGNPLPQDVGGLTLTPGVYCFPVTGANLTGTLTLDFQGDPNAFFLIRAPGPLFTASGSDVDLINTAGVTCPASVYWHVGGSATLGSGSTFSGNIVALTGVTVTTGATVNGSVLARNGSATLDTNIITRCAPVPEAELSVSATSAPASVAPGGDITYTIDVTNQGPDAADGAELTATLPSGLGFKSLVAPAGWTCTTPDVGAAGTVTCSNESFAPGVDSFALVATLGAGATAVPPVTVGVSSDTLDPDPTNETAVASGPLVAPPAPPPPVPTPPPAVVPPAAPTSTPAPVVCTSRRAFTVQLKTLGETGRVVSAQLRTAKGKALRTLRVTRSQVKVNLRGLPKQRLNVRVTVRTRAGKLVRVTRNYGTCGEEPKTR